jgi:hypothetical protein
MRNTLKIATVVLALTGVSFAGAAFAYTDGDQPSGGASDNAYSAPTGGIASAVTGAAHLNGSHRDGTGVTPTAATASANTQERKDAATARTRTASSY